MSYKAGREIFRFFIDKCKNTCHSDVVNEYARIRFQKTKDLVHR